MARYIRLHEALVSFWAERLPDRVHIVDYEALTEDPEPVIRELVAFAGLPWDDACLAPQSAQSERRDAEFRAGAPADRARLRRRMAAVRGGVGRPDRRTRPRGAAGASARRLRAAAFRNDERRPLGPPCRIRFRAGLFGRRGLSALPCPLGADVARPDRLDAPSRSSWLHPEGSSSSGGSSCARSLICSCPRCSSGLAANCRIIATALRPVFGRRREFFVQRSRGRFCGLRAG
jgi:hypothetical protein